MRKIALLISILLIFTFSSSAIFTNALDSTIVLFDDLTDFSKIFEHSGTSTLSTWSNPASMPSGDTNGLVMLSVGGERYIKYTLTGSETVKAEYVYYSGDDNYAKGKIEIFYSPDNSTYTKATASTVFVNAYNNSVSNWKRMLTTSSELPSSARYVKLVYNTAGNVWEPILVNVTISKAAGAVTPVPTASPTSSVSPTPNPSGASDNISDDLTGFDKIFAHSGLDTLTTFSNPASMPSGDTSGLVMLNTEGERYVIYSTNGNASVKADYLYYSGDENYAKDKIKVYYSADNTSYTQAASSTSYVNSYQDITSNWKRMSSTTGVLPESAKFIKLSFDTTGNAWEPILVNVSITRSQSQVTPTPTPEPSASTPTPVPSVNIIDDLVNADKMYSSSSNVIFTTISDPSNALYLLINEKFGKDFTVALRNDALNGYMTYEKDDRNMIEVVYYTYDADDGSSHVKLQSSIDGTSWMDISASPKITREDGDVFGKSTLKASLPSSSKFVRVAIVNNKEANAWDPMVASINISKVDAPPVINPGTADSTQLPLVSAMLLSLLSLAAIYGLSKIKRSTING